MQQLSSKRLLAGPTALLITGSFCYSASSSSLESELQLGIRSYNAKHYPEAVSHLRNHLKANRWQVPIASYYLACAYQNLHNEGEAWAEFSNAMYWTTDPKLKEYCQTALNTNPTYIKMHALAVSNHSSGSMAPTPPGLETAMQRMQIQSSVEVQTIQKAGEDEKQKIKNGERDAIRELQRRRDAALEVINSSDAPNLMIPARISGVKYGYEKDVAKQKEQTAKELKWVEDRIAERIKNAQNQGQWAQSQVVELQKKSNLQLTGTDMFTRFYGRSPAKLEPDELLATPERLVIDAHSTAGRSVSHTVPVPPMVRPSTPGLDLRVNGKLVAP